VRRILITGGTGFVGCHLIRSLKSFDVKIFAISSGEVSTPEPGVDYLKADIRRADEIGSIIREANPEQVYHLAAVSTVGDAGNDPRSAFDTNVLGSYNVFGAVMRLPVPPRVLYVSTSQVYASSDHALAETSLSAPDNHYAATKAMAELLAVQYRKASSGGIIIARAFNHTGPGQRTSFVMPSIAKQLAEAEAGLCPPVIKVGNLNVRRDFTDVRDVVMAYQKLIANGKTGETYNVCSGRAVFLEDLVRELQKQCRVKTEIQIDQNRVRANEVALMLGDPGKLYKTTGWTPRLPVENTLQALLDYWRIQIARHLPEANGAVNRSPQA
jgi:GDP-4-dehydro-6-deoxy-D-mannose reductase